ncbi:xylulokinase [Maribius pontilimi]|uniref:Xylulose kinase n=1 Tax=Palleronia pontilimi TaxID=1964209 RepID=A0A934MF97_9RHOB|nr:xylulokinase [Palleronia pontilimi]MBJ3764281.1 xylulokinase [Palleronia pontilimi]
MYLGIDLGTSGVKTILLDGADRVTGQASAPLQVSRPHPNWSEQDPADWIAATEATLDQLADAHDLGGVAGIGLSGQMHGATCIDATDAVMRPCILWNDTRAHAEAARMDADGPFREITGNIVFPGFTAPKIAWMRAHEPELFDRIDCVLLPKDYLRLWLTGARVAEMSDAAGTSWLDMAARDWSDDCLAATGLGRDRMPSLVEGSQPSGGLRATLASRWGMRADIPVAGGAGDNAATAVGLGVLSEGQGFVSLGTSGVLFAATDGYRPNAESAVHTFCHALPDTWHQMGVILSAASALDWLAGVLGAAPGALIDELGDTPQPPGRVTFLPYLSGERTPHNDATLTGSFDGLTHATGRADLTRAVLEGVTLALGENLAALQQAGTSLARVTAAGGGSRARYWLKLIAATLDLEVQVPAAGEHGAALGAARLGAMAAGDAGDAFRAAPTMAETISPDRELGDAMRARSDRFSALRDAHRPGA